MQSAHTQGDSQALRQLGPTEHMFWLLSQGGTGHHLLAAEVATVASVDGWRAALRQMQRRHPYFSVWIDGSVASAPRFRRSEDAEIPLRVVPQGAGVRVESEMEKELGTPFDTQRAPLVRAVLIHGAEKSVLILVMHHAIGDGLSAAYAIRDLLRALGGESLAALPLVPTQDELLGFQQSPPASAGAPGAAAPGSGAPAPGELAVPKIERLRLSKELTGQIVERAKREQTTVHGALCAALITAGRQMYPDWGQGPVRFFSSINTRKLLGVQEDCGLFVSPSVCDLEADTDFWSLARSARGAVAPWQTLPAVTQVMQNASGMTQMDAAAAAQLAGGLYLGVRFTITNLGALAVQTVFGDVALQAMWGPGVLAGHPGEQTIGVSTLNGAMCLMHSSYTPLPALLAGVEKVLVGACRPS